MSMLQQKKSHDDSVVASVEEMFGSSRTTLQKYKPELESRILSEQRDTDLLLFNCQQALLSTVTLREAFRAANSNCRAAPAYSAWRTEPWKLSVVFRSV